MPPMRRTRLSRRTSEADRLYNLRDRETTSERTQRVEEQRVRTAGNRIHRNVLKTKSAFSYCSNIDYLSIPYIQIGAMTKICPKCKAKKWKDEALGLCCADGKVDLRQFEEPPDLIECLLTDQHPESKHFLLNSRQYNTLFQMTSFGAKEIQEGFMPTFKIQGQVYHRIGSLFPEEGDNPKFLQIYFTSESDQVTTRSNMLPNSNLKRSLIESLQTVLKDHNHLLQSLKTNILRRCWLFYT